MKKKIDDGVGRDGGKSARAGIIADECYGNTLLLEWTAEMIITTTLLAKVTLQENSSRFSPWK